MTTTSCVDGKYVCQMKHAMKHYFLLTAAILIVFFLVPLLGSEIGFASEKEGVINKESREPDSESDEKRTQAYDSMIDTLIEKTQEAVKGAVNLMVSPLDVSSELGQAAMSAKSWIKQIPGRSDKKSGSHSSIGDTVSSGVKSVYDASEEVVTEVVTVGKKAGGKEIEQITQNVVVPVRWVNAIGLSTMEYASFVAEGKDPIMLIAVPVASAIRAARNHHYPDSRPIPQYIKSRLYGFYPNTVLNEARYVVGNFELSLPNALNYGTEIFKGSDNASVMNEVVIFRRQPAESDDSDLYWWAHELHHVHQYYMWGIDRFAYYYVINPTVGGWIEQQADHKALHVLAELGVEPMRD